MTLSQNIDNLSPRAGHPPTQLRQLHGNLFDLRCCDEAECGYVERGNFKDPLTSALAPQEDEKRDTPSADASNVKRAKATAWLLEGIARKNKQILGSGYKDSAPARADQAALKSEGDADDEARLAGVPEPSKLSPDDLPQCRKCSASLMRPNVVWFGEALPADLMEEVDAMFADPEPIDLCIIVGTSGSVWPAAGFADLARKKVVRIAVINLDAADVKNIRPGKDWVFFGDASAIIPDLLLPIVGNSEE
jgi:NAD+-dependent protein deacetylase sirtuin 5